MLKANSKTKDTPHLSLAEVQAAELTKLRAKLKVLRDDRDKIILEKGLVAQDNKDLRENAAYDDLERQEHSLTAKIHDIIEEIYARAKKS